MTKNKISQKKEDFQIWLDVMQVRIQQLKSSLPIEVSKNLDLSIESLDVLERYILDKYRSVDEIKGENEVTQIVDLLARYYGEVLRKDIKMSGWYIITDKKNHSFYNLPIIYFVSPTYTTICPYYEILACISKQKGNFLSTIAKNMKRNIEEKDNGSTFINEFIMPAFS